jgi:protein arginine kinase
MKKNNEPHLLLKKTWIDNHNDIWLASVFNLYRNIENYPFPAKMISERRQQVIPLIGNELMKVDSLINPTFCKGEEATALEKEFLMEHFLTNQNYKSAYTGEAFITDDTHCFLTTLNIDDHIQMHLIDTEGELEKSWNKLVNIEMQVGKRMAYAFNPRFGFLTTDPATSGTGLSIVLYLQPSALIHENKLENFLDEINNKNLKFTGLQGNPHELIGDILKVTNRFTLGVNEESIISELRSFTTKLVLEESALRMKIKAEGVVEIKDKVSRAFGVLKHSYTIEAIEALNAISLLKLGSELGWLKGVTTAKLNELLFTTRRAHLIRHFDLKEISQQELPHKRAEFIHKILENTELNI